MQFCHKVRLTNLNELLSFCHTALMPTRSIDAHETFKIGEKKGYKSRVLHVENHMYTSKACYGVVWSRQIRGHNVSHKCRVKSLLQVEPCHDVGLNNHS